VFIRIRRRYCRTSCAKN